jgi:hypothetical protein
VTRYTIYVSAGTKEEMLLFRHGLRADVVPERVAEALEISDRVVIEKERHA